MVFYLAFQVNILGELSVLSLFSELSGLWTFRKASESLLSLLAEVIQLKYSGKHQSGSCV